MLRIFLNNNGFSGDTDFSSVLHFEYVNVAHTKLSGVVYDFPGVFLGVDDSDVRHLRKEDGTEIGTMNGQSRRYVE